MRLRELENAVGKEEKGTSTLLVPKQTNMEILTRLARKGGGINFSTLSVKDNLLSPKPPKLSKNPGEPSFDAPPF